jgi:hypothetical protein
MMKTKLWTSPHVQEKVHIILDFSCITIHEHVQFEKLSRIMNGLNCALHHSVLSFVKLFIDMNIHG